MSNFRDKVKQKIDEGADSAKKTRDRIADNAKELAHKAGKKLESDFRMCRRF